MNNQSDVVTRSGFVALIGAPNAGKSTLINQLVGEKISIVTHKVQTTRRLIRGIVQYQQSQIILVDTPGIFKPGKNLDKAMVSTAWQGVKDADIILLLIDAVTGITSNVEELLQGIVNNKKRKLLVLNKVDKIDRKKLLALTNELNQKVNFQDTFMISALTSEGCEDLIKYLAEHLPLGPFYYPEDQISDLPLRYLAAEITREKLLLRLHEEIPYAATVETEIWEEKKDGSVKVQQVIYVERQNQKRIILGHNGETIKAIGQASRLELSEFLKQKVHLFLFVKVRPNWRSDAERYKEMGLNL
ncbi:GTPase Era [Bartonella sp. DGB1]|uniref:GTPase Era n=1 Tax=Bartonella sp. DGB1 TaxID=3239807 RepID=UPI003525C9F6